MLKYIAFMKLYLVVFEQYVIVIFEQLNFLSMLVNVKSDLQLFKEYRKPKRSRNKTAVHGERSIKNILKYRLKITLISASHRKGDIRWA